MATENKHENKVETSPTVDTKPSENTTSRPPSAYNLFIKDTSNRTAHGGEDAKETMRKLGAAWKALGDEDRAIWTEKAVEAKADWESKGGAPPKKKKGSKKKKKGRAPTAYNLFIKDPSNRKANGGEDAKETLRKLAVAWKGLDEPAKATWNEKAAEVKTEWEAKQAEEAEAASDSDEEKKTKKKAKKAKKESTNTMTAFQHFLHNKDQIDEYRRQESAQDKGLHEIRLMMSKAWLNFSDDEKAPWEAQVVQAAA